MIPGIKKNMIALPLAGCLLYPMVIKGQDEYTSGFYTRGPEAVEQLGREDASAGPFYIQFGDRLVLLPRITLSASYEDNANLSGANPEEAATMYTIPGLLLMYGAPDRNHLYVDTGLIIPVYSDSDRLDEEVSYLATLGGVSRMGKTSMQGRLGYRRMENVDTLVGARMVRKDYTGDLGLEHRLSRKTSLGLSGSASFFDFDDPRYISYWRYYGAGRGFYRITPKSDAYLQLGAGIDDLQEDVNAGGDAEFYDVSIGLRGKQSPKTTIGGRVGYRWRQTRDDAFEDVNHYIASLNAETSPFGLTTFTALWNADINPSVGDAGFATVDQRVTLSASRRLMTERMRGRAAVFAGMVDYFGQEGRPVDPLDDTPVYDGREDDYWGYSLGLDAWLQYNLSIGLQYSYFENRGARGGTEEEQQDSSYDSGRWGLRLSWNY